MNHPFVEGSKRLGHAAMAVLLYPNGHEIVASVSEQEQVIVQLAAAPLGREVFTDWLRTHVMARANS
jgi:death-on-curing protein